MAKTEHCSGKFKPQARHPQPKTEADALLTTFVTRSNTSQLPLSTRNRLAALSPQKDSDIQQALQETAESDEPFTQQEVKQALKINTNTAPGLDNISYSMLNHLGPEALSQLHLLFNKSLAAGRLPTSWKVAVIQPIPKTGQPTSYRPISLLSCLGKTMERAILTRLSYYIPHPHQNIYAYTKGLSTKDNQTALKASLPFWTSRKPLANSKVIISILASRGISGKLLIWTKDYLQDRKAHVQFQGTLSDVQSFENGTPQGGIVSPFLFNILIADLLSIQLPSDTYLLAYADDLQVISTGRNRFVHAQMVLDRLVGRCKHLGLKISFGKPRSLQTRHFIPDQRLYIDSDGVEWTNSHKCLGV